MKLCVFPGKSVLNVEHLPPLCCRIKLAHSSLGAFDVVLQLKLEFHFDNLHNKCLHVDY